MLASTLIFLVMLFTALYTVKILYLISLLEEAKPKTVYFIPWQDFTVLMAGTGASSSIFYFWDYLSALEGFHGLAGVFSSRYLGVYFEILMFWSLIVLLFSFCKAYVRSRIFFVATGFMLLILVLLIPQPFSSHPWRF